MKLKSKRLLSQLKRNYSLYCVLSELAAGKASMDGILSKPYWEGRADKVKYFIDQLEDHQSASERKFTEQDYENIESRSYLIGRSDEYMLFKRKLSKEDITREKQKNI